MMRVQELSAAMGFNVYLTGGTVRDLVTGASLRDLDFSVEGNPSKIARELEYVSSDDYATLASEYEIVGKQLYRLMQHWRTLDSSPPTSRLQEPKP